MDVSNRVEVSFQMSGADLERLVVIGGDLDYLISLPKDRLLSHTEVRLGASVLRRLFVDNEFKRVWRTMGASEVAQPTVQATNIDPALNAWPWQWILYAWAGGAKSYGAHHTGFILGSVPKDDHEKYPSVGDFLAANPMPVQGEVMRMTLDDWLKSTSVAIRTNEMGLVRISRASMIKYIANRKGGVHFDPRRDLPNRSSKNKLRDIESSLLDHGLLRVGHLSGPEYEVASIIRAVATSDWAPEIVRTAQSAAPADFHGDPDELKFWTGQREADGTGWATSRFNSTVLGVDQATA
ncbi:hypothetical protein [Nonomuraea pusilla]|uniref:Uncharacterized protein n=1 Tax=Nonomuraea pusilla TaxID=46177 RepID=A0A1H8EQI9_9ACTN|nr:hypothetical protein [Nonomuraea pusilla]SEN21769.1 hypothetical protein SAMN05660976_07070 [Nonomuraea pusilla]